MTRLPRRALGNVAPMLRKLVWSGLYAAFGAAATMAARRAASGIWRLATDDEPPTER
jgi:hypothetical protein